MTSAAFYRRDDGGGLVPTELAAGPAWLPGSQHGSAVTALMARAVEATPSAGPMHLARLTVDLSRRVPTGPTEVRSAIARDGRRVQLVETDLVVDGEVRARAHALRIRVDDGVIAAPDLPAAWPDDDAGGEPGPDAGTAASPTGSDGLWEAHHARWVDGTPGAGVVWLRPSHPLVDGEPLTPTIRVALVADLVMSGGGLLSHDDYLVVNPDLTLLLSRPPIGEWIAVHSRVRLRPDGTGQSEGALYDEHGWIGRALKTLLVDRRSG